MIVSIIMTLMISVQNTISGYIDFIETDTDDSFFLFNIERRLNDSKMSLEKVEVSGCESCRLMLTCRQLDSIIAILDTDFTAESPIFDTDLVKKTSIAFPPDHPRDALNKRCSGLNHCSFILTEDSPGSEAWGAGNITVKYACATHDRVQRFCNSQHILNENITNGILHNPGYPRFYAGQNRCIWKISAPSHQKLKLRILDVALFDTRVSSPEDCKDILEIKDSGQTIYSTCSQEHPPFEVMSATESVEVILTSRQAINPRRGVLIYYKAIGCPLPLPPKRGYLVFRNDSVATYTCCRGYVFPDTQTKTRTLRCYGATWNISLPLLDCEEPENWGSINLQEVLKKTSTMASDLIAPIILMVILFALNGVVIFYIHRAKKNAVRQTLSSKYSTQPEMGRDSYGSMR